MTDEFTIVSIQILHYEFLGPVPLSQWGPPMEKIIYVIFGREKDKFNPVYAGLCEKTEDVGFFTSMDSFKCWISMAGSEQSLYLAILPVFNSDTRSRQRILGRVVSELRPPCNKPA